MREREGGVREEKGGVLNLTHPYKDHHIISYITFTPQ